MTSGIAAAAIVLALAVPEVKLSPASAGVLRVVVVGDIGWGTAEVAAGIAALHRQKKIDAILVPGDNIYPCGVKSERDPKWSSVVGPLSALGIPIFPVLGNHDYCGDEDAQVRATGVVPNWRMPAREYAVRAGLADLAMIDTNVPYTSTVRDVFAASKARWRIVVGHHTVIASGYHHWFRRRDRRTALLPVLRAAKVDLYVCGHDHHQELIDGKPRHLISGAGSRPVPPVLLHRNTLFPQSIGRERKGFAVVEMTFRELRVRFHEARGRAISGAFVFDKR